LGRAVARKSAADGKADAMELQVLRPAQQAVSRGDFPSALAAIAEHQHRFPSGQLAEEREALRVKALLGLGRMSEAQSAGATFHERFSSSALRERIDEMLGTPR
jgi:TolA-binding protein